MKKLIISLGILVGVIVLSIIVIGIAYTDPYEKQPQVQYDEVLTNTKPTIYYYYQDDCGYCKSIKPQILEMADKANNSGMIEFKFINLGQNKNSVAWYDGEDWTTDPNYISDPAKMKTIEDIKITGTPGMILTENNEVKQYKIGKDVFDILEEANTTYSLGVDLDREKYQYIH